MPAIAIDALMELCSACDISVEQGMGVMYSWQSALCWGPGLVL